MLDGPAAQDLAVNHALQKRLGPVGGLFFLLLAKFSLEIPVDSVKTEKKED